MSISYVIGGRGSGKTRFLIEKSAVLKIPIVCNNPSFVEYTAKDMGIDIPKPLSYFDVVNGKPNHTMGMNGVLIDELPWMFNYMGLNPYYFTMDSDDFNEIIYLDGDKRDTEIIERYSAGTMTRHQLEADIDYLEKIIDECENDGNLTRATVIKIILKDFKEAIRDYIYFNDRGIALRKIKEVDKPCPYGETRD